MANTTTTLSAEPVSSYPSDEEILGLVEETAAAPTSALASERELLPPDAAGVEDALLTTNDEPAGPQASEVRAESRSSSAGETAAMPEWMIQVSAAVPQASAQLAGLWQQAAALESFDHAFYGNNAADREQFLSKLSNERPAEFRAMLAAAEKILTTHQPSTRPGEPARNTAQALPFNATAYADFERATNDAVVAELSSTISRALDRALSADVPEGARRRIANDTLSEIHGTLRGDRQLSSQVASVVRGGRLDADARAVVVRLIAARARGLVAPAAKRVIGEWTSSVLATDRERAARQKNAQSRIDITGGAVPQSVPRKAMRPAEIDYHRTSDEEILAW